MNNKLIGNESNIIFYEDENNNTCKCQYKFVQKEENNNVQKRENSRYPKYWLFMPRKLLT